jgi:hypothetical protein
MAGPRTPRSPPEAPNHTITLFNYLRQDRSPHFPVNFLIRCSNRCGFLSGGIRSRRNNKGFFERNRVALCQRAASLKIRGFCRCSKPCLIPPALSPESYEGLHKNNVKFQWPWACAGIFRRILDGPDSPLSLLAHHGGRVMSWRVCLQNGPAAESAWGDAILTLIWRVCGQVSTVFSYGTSS